MAGVRRSLSVDLGGLVLATPVMVASGCAGTGREFAGLVDVHKVGAVVSRSVTLQPRKGTPTPRIAESPSGVVWETGMQNPGIDAFVEEELPRLGRGGTPVVVSIAGGTLEEYVRLTGILQGRAVIVDREADDRERIGCLEREAERALRDAQVHRPVRLALVARGRPRRHVGVLGDQVLVRNGERRPALRVLDA